MKLLIQICLIVILFSCGSSKTLVQPDLTAKKEGTETPVIQKEIKTEIPKIQDKQIFSILPYDKEDLDLEELKPQEKPDVPGVATKVNGFRIQVLVLSDFSKTKEYEATINDQLKNQSHIVYVDFYSPNYRIRLGDFKTRDEARKNLPLIISLGYRDAFIVPDIINVQSSDKPE